MRSRFRYKHGRCSLRLVSFSCVPHHDCSPPERDRGKKRVTWVWAGPKHHKLFTHTQAPHTTASRPSPHSPEQIDLSRSAGRPNLSSQIILKIYRQIASDLNKKFRATLSNIEIYEGHSREKRTEKKLNLTKPMPCILNFHFS
jgi:hypothetical protein